MDDNVKSQLPEKNSLWSCNPKDISPWSPEDVKRLKDVLEKYIFEPNRQINEKIRTNTDA